MSSAAGTSASIASVSSTGARTARTHDRRRALLPVAGILGGTLVGVATAALVRRARGERDDRWWFLADGLAIDFEKGGVSVKPYAEVAVLRTEPAPPGSDEPTAAERGPVAPDPTTA